VNENDIAIVGLAGRFPGASDVDTFWANLCAGTESIRRFTDEELLALGVPSDLLGRPDFVKAAPVLDDVAGFDHAFWGYSPREAELMDPQQRLFLQTAWASLEHAGYDPLTYPGLIGVFGGMGLSTYLLFNLAGNPAVRESDTPLAMLGNDKDFLSTRVSYHLNLRGPSITIQSGCSTSLVAAHLACDSLLNFQCDMALAGGATIAVPQRTGYLYVPGGTASPDGHCRAFDADAGGTLFGSGVGVVVLKRLADAIEQRDTVYAVIKGSAVNNDGVNKVGFTAPSIEGQAEVVVRAQHVADVDPATIGYIETHGTATKLGDPIEVAAITRAFRAATQEKAFCAIGSVKTNVGHLDTAAGVASLIKATLAVYHGKVPPSLNFHQPNPQIDFEHSPFYVNTELSPWPINHGARRAGVSAFGFGGTNAHLVLEQAPQAVPGPAPDRPQVIVLSAKSPAALSAMTERLAEHLERQPDTSLADAAYTLQRGRAVLEHRRCLVAADVTEAMALLRNPSPWVRDRRQIKQGRPVAFLFSGLGDQYVGMAQGLYERAPAFRAAFDECAELLRPLLGIDIRHIVYPEGREPGPATNPKAGLDLKAMLLGVQGEARIEQTRLAHPVLFAVEYALAQQWLAWGVRPAALIGHSLGEYVAATIAGVFALADALLLVAKRAELIEAQPGGAMLAVPLGADETQRLLGPELSVALLNGPSLTVVAGAEEPIAELEAKLVASNLACRRLRAGHAFHTAALSPIVEPFVKLVASVGRSAPQIPYLSNVTGAWITPDEATDPEYWGAHTASPVRFDAGLAELCHQRDQVLLELGPGQSLSALAGEHLERTGRGQDCVVLPSLRASYDTRQTDEVFLLDVLGQLWLAGVNVDWDAVHDRDRPRRIALPTYPFERHRAWIDPDTTAASRRSAPSGRHGDPDDWFLAPVWRTRPPSRPRVKPVAQRWLVFSDGSALARELVGRLHVEATSVVTVESGQGFERLRGSAYRIDPAQAEGYERLCAGLRHDGLAPDQVLHLWGGDEEATGFDEAQRLGFYSLAYLTRALASLPGHARLWVAARGIVAAESADVLRPEAATALAVAKCAPQEYPNLSLGFIDLGPSTAAVGAQAAPRPSTAAVGAQAAPRPSTATTDQTAFRSSTATAEAAFRPRDTAIGRTAEHLLDLFAEGPDDRLIAYRRGRLLLPDFAPATLAPQAFPLRPEGVYLITGGLGQIGLALAEQLARQARARLVLIGRSAFPDRNQWPQWLRTHDATDSTSRRIQRLRRILDLGADVLILKADASRPQALRAAVVQAEEHFGAVHAVVHAAGIGGARAFTMLAETSPQRSQPQFSAKVLSCQALAEVLGDRPLDFCLLLSSNAALLGGIGGSTYTACNIFVDTFAEAHSAATGRRWISVNLEEWLPDAEDADQHKYEVSFTKYGITAAEGVGIVQRVVEGATGSRVTLVTGDLQERIDQWIRRPQAAVPPAPGQRRHPRPDLSVAFEAPQGEHEAAVAAVWEEILGIEALGRHDNFYELGGHSLLATQIVARLRAALKVEISMLSLFAAPTVAGFAGAVRDAQALDEAPAYPPLRTVPRDGAPEPSYAQRRFWFLDRLAPGNPFYNIADVVRIEGPLDQGLLRHGINQIIARHEALRTTLRTAGDEPVQHIAETVEIDLTEIDLSEVDADTRPGQLMELARGEERAPFDLAEGPLIRATVVRLAASENILLLTTHHSVSDAWSTGIFIRELAELYAAGQQRRPAALQPLRLQYADFAQWQRELLTGAMLERLLGYWRGHLAGAPPLLALPTDLPRPPVQSFNGAVRPLTIPAELVSSVRKLASEQGCTLFMALLAAFDCLLYRYTGQRDLVVGSPIAGRLRPELEDLIGTFVNMLPMRVRVDPDLTFTQLLARVREVTLGGYTHQELPFEMLVEAISPERNLSHSPVFQTVFVLQNAPLPDLELGDLTLRPLEMQASTAKFDLLFMFRETEEGAVGGIEYATDLFRPETVAALGQRFLVLLEAVASQPDIPIGDLDILTDGEHAELRRHSHGEMMATGPRTLAELLSDSAAATPNRIALIAAQDETTGLTFAEIEAAANRLAHALAARGIGPGRRVGLHIPRSTNTILTLLGVIKCGAAYVPLDPSYPAARVDFMIADAQLDLLITETREAGRAAVVTPRELWREAETRPSQPLGHIAGAEDPAYVIYTSGSTGQPKGVIGLHGGMVNRLEWMWAHYPFQDNDVLCQKTSLNFLDSFWEIFGPLCRGVPLVVLPHDMVADPRRLIGALARHRVTRLVLVPSLLRALLEAPGSLAERLPDLRLVVTSGEALPPALARDFRAAMPGCELLNLYGSSEISADVTYHPVGDGDGGREVVPIGRPLRNVSVHVLDERGRSVPPGAIGEIYVGGMALGHGYLGRPAMTAERFLPDPFSTRPGHRLFRTGDLGRIGADGVIEYRGRNDQQVKVRGFRIELAEVEAALRGHPDIADCLVVNRGDLLQAYVVPHKEIQAEALREHLVRVLPNYMVPNGFAFLEALPLTPSGKVDRTALPQATPLQADRPVQAPRNDTEQVVAAVLTGLLQTTQPTSQPISVHDNFFAVGGHSLLATRLVTRLTEYFEVDIPLRVFFEEPTIAGLAGFLLADPHRRPEIEQRAPLLLMIAQMSEDEVERMLADPATEGRPDGGA